MYYRGEGVMQEYQEAVRWYSKAAEKGLAKAQYNLGLMYFKGHGVSKNYVKAYMWLYLAAAQRFQDAAMNRDFLAAKNDASPKSTGAETGKQMEA